MQMIDLLLSTFNNAIQKNQELEKAHEELLNMHDELKKTNQELKQSVEEQNRVVGIAAHDLRNPLNVIMGYSDFILKHLGNITPDHLIQFITSIKERSHFMLNMVNDLLDLSKIQSGKLNLNLKPVSVQVLVKKNVALNLVMAEKKNIKLRLQIDDNLPVMNVDPEKIEQVLNNLIGNAVKYSYPDSKVNINISRQNGSLLLAVEDHGVGIPAEEIDSLF